MATKVSTMTTVQKVDKTKRQLMVKDSQGSQFKVNVPEDVTNLDAIDNGDRVAIDYFTSVALSIEKAKKGKAPSASATTMAERTVAPLPDGQVAQKVSATAEVLKVDKTANKLTIKRPAGQVDTIDVSDPQLRSKLATLKKGDKIHASYTEAVAVRLTPQEAPQDAPTGT
ncbi:MAG: hypothetical protein AB7O24_29495 [Kofleriaceae bacterium]